MPPKYFNHFLYLKVILLFHTTIFIIIYLLKNLIIELFQHKHHIDVYQSIQTFRVFVGYLKNIRNQSDHYLITLSIILTIYEHLQHISL